MYDKLMLNLTSLSLRRLFCPVISIPYCKCGLKSLLPTLRVLRVVLASSEQTSYSSKKSTWKKRSTFLQYFNKVKLATLLEHLEYLLLD